MQINCLHCGHKFDLGKNYDDYEGLVRCGTCAGLLDVRTQEGDVKAVRFGAVPTAAAPVAPQRNTQQAIQPAIQQAAPTPPPALPVPSQVATPAARIFHPFQGFGGPPRPAQGGGERDVA